MSVICSVCDQAFDGVGPDDSWGHNSMRCTAERLPRLKLHYTQLCSVASIEVDWLQRLVTGDEAMKQIGAILSGR